MLKVILEKEENTIELCSVPENTPIFAKSEGKLIGMVAFDHADDGYFSGWMLRLAGCRDAAGFHETRQECIKSALDLGYELFVEEQVC